MKLAGALVGTLWLVAVMPRLAQAREGRDHWFAQDKAKHFGVSAALAGLGYAGTAPLTDARDKRLAAGAGLALTAGIAKEMWDRRSGGDPSLKDLTWDALGTITGLTVSWMIDRWLQAPAERSTAPAP